MGQKVKAKKKRKRLVILPILKCVQKRLFQKGQSFSQHKATEWELYHNRWSGQRLDRHYNKPSGILPRIQNSEDYGYSDTGSRGGVASI